MSLYLRDVVWQATGNVAAQGLGIAAMPIITRLYQPSDFATLNLFSQTVAGLAVLLTLRFEHLVMLPRSQRESESILRLVFGLGAIHVLWMTPVLAVLPSKFPWIRSQGAIADWLWLAPPSAWVLSLSVGLQNAVQRKGDFRNSAISEFSGRCAYVACTVVGALALPNIFGLMMSTFVTAGAKLVWLIRVGGGFLRVALTRNGSSISKSVRRIAISTTISNLISLFTGLAPMIFISEHYGSSSLGQYGLVVSTLYLPTTLVGQAIGQVYYQRACSLKGEGKHISGLLVETSFHLVKIGVPLYAMIALAAPSLYPFVFGQKWIIAGEMARYLTIAALAGFISTPLDRTSIVADAWWYLSAWHTLRAMMTVACLTLSDIYGLPLEYCVMLLSVQHVLAYSIDWVASYMFATRLHRGS